MMNGTGDGYDEFAKKMGWKDGPTLEGKPVSPPQEQPWPTLGQDALYGLPGDVVRLIAPHSESDPVALLVQFIVYFGNAVGRYPYYQIEDDRHYPNLFAVLVGQSSKSRKGTSAGRIEALMAHADEADMKWSQSCRGNGLSTGEGLLHRIRDAVHKPVKGKLECVDEGVIDHRLLVDEREFYQALTVMKRSGNTLSRMVRDGWDRGDLQIMTRAAPLRSTNAHISIVGHITVDELRDNLDHTSIMNGFANRFLFVCVKRSDILLPHGGGDLDVEQQRIVIDKLCHAMGRARCAGRVTMTEAAEKAWEGVYTELSKGHPGMFGAACGRAEAQTTRLALLYALLDSSRQIDKVHLQAALALWDYCEQSAKHVFGDLFGERMVDTILLALRENGSVGLTREQIYHLFSGNESKSRIVDALQKLALAGKARQFEKKGEVGRPATVWVADNN
jgi:hypothetical protein